jgi:hypothetical protein
MEPSYTFYVYDNNKNVIQIRTKLNTHNPPMYVIQHCIPRKSSTDKIQYRSEIVDEKRFYTHHSGVENIA